ncbi:class A beta-lactamase [Sphingosinicella sp. LHD-64]|uniref:class A beta-lactamase n=1 Tax=Sphingosinicella sp. LHD-64 TaxID=3072139 RepID=UPI00280CF58C|nr:class A beta-lactamase [Sphingosinicella sp. LHD-64]MDQ8756236.1 class A beta-lactamase [Sphingosinicella sp. LHD-64]
MTVSTKLSQDAGLSRRSAMFGIGAFTILPVCTAAARAPAGWDLGRIEATLGGRIGVSAVNLQTHQSLAHREHDRFAMCSTFKWALAAQVLAEVDRGEADLEERLSYSQDDLVPYSPITGPRASHGFMTIGDLCAAAVTISDNTAANLLLRRFGGPIAFTAFLRRAGDDVTRLDRMETDLNENAAGDPRDTTTPAAMVGTMSRFLFGELLSTASRNLLRTLMQSSTTGTNRLRAGFPLGWTVGDKTGTSINGASNDVAFALPGNGSGPILIACYIDAPDATAEARNAAHEHIARKVALHLA